LSGAVQRLAVNGEKVALVSHRSAAKIAGTQSHLVKCLQARFGVDRVRHFPVRLTLDEHLGQEATHRSRSFLFAVLGAVVARLFSLDSISFFENGVVSLNLPLAAQVVGARATRTTHPQALAGFRTLLAHVFGQPFGCNNPFMWNTKSEVVASVAANGCRDLIRHTRSCTRIRDMTRHNPHCGRCSQCIDRRFAILASGQEAEDPAEAYNTDLFVGEREPGTDREMALAFVRTASDMSQMADVAFFSRYGEASRVVACFPEPANTVASRILDLHQRHAAAVCGVFDKAIQFHAANLRQGSLPADCLVSLVVSQTRTEDFKPGSPEPLDRIIPPVPAIQMAVDMTARGVVIGQWGEIGDVGAELIIALVAPFRQAVHDELSSMNYPFTATKTLVRQLRCGAAETLRRRVQRCRADIEKLARGVGPHVPAPDAVVESHQWRGYRLNPDYIRLVAHSELVGSK
jgi:hypothetical protein